jgi:hypothetical protein
VSTLTVSTKQKQIAAPGIIVETIGLKSCRFNDHLYDSAFHPGNDLPVIAHDEDEGVDLKAEVNVFFRGTEGAVVELSLTAQPRSQPTWSANVTVFGHYLASAEPAVPLNQFAWNNGIAYLVPFARERLASLTGASIYHSYFLPPLSVPSILASAGMSPAALTESSVTSSAVESPPARRKIRSARKTQDK